MLFLMSGVLSVQLSVIVFSCNCLKWEAQVIIVSYDCIHQILNVYLDYGVNYFLLL